MSFDLRPAGGAALGALGVMVVSPKLRDDMRLDSGWPLPHLVLHWATMSAGPGPLIRLTLPAVIAVLAGITAASLLRLLTNVGRASFGFLGGICVGGLLTAAIPTLALAVSLMSVLAIVSMAASCARWLGTGSPGALLLASVWAFIGGAWSPDFAAVLACIAGWMFMVAARTHGRSLDHVGVAAGLLAFATAWGLGLAILVWVASGSRPDLLSVRGDAGAVGITAACVLIAFAYAVSGRASAWTMVLAVPALVTVLDWLMFGGPAQVSIAGTSLLSGRLLPAAVTGVTVDRVLAALRRRSEVMV